MSDHNEDGFHVDASHRSSPSQRKSPPLSDALATTHYYPTDADAREGYVELARGGTRRSHPPSVRPTHYYPTSTGWDREDGYNESSDEGDWRRNEDRTSPSAARYYHTSSTRNSPYIEDLPESPRYHPDAMGHNWPYVDPDDLLPAGHKGGQSRRGADSKGRKGKLSTPMHPATDRLRQYDEHPEFGFSARGDRVCPHRLYRTS